MRSDRWIIKWRWPIVTGFIGMTLLLAVWIPGVTIDSDLRNHMPDTMLSRVNTEKIEALFGGTEILLILFEREDVLHETTLTRVEQISKRINRLKDPLILKRIDQYEKELKGFPGIGNTVSIARVIKKINQALNDPEDLEQLVDFEYENAQLIIRVNEGNTSTVKNIVKEVDRMVKDDPAATFIGGSSLAVAELADLVVRGQFISLFVALAVITLLMMILFRSWFAGLLSAIPLILAIAMLFGLMGYIRIPLDIVSALLSSIMIGVGVDYTIHFLWRYREERENGLSYNDAVVKTITTTGRGILFNALSVIIGFSALFVSSFIPVKIFAFLVVVSISGCLLGALVLVPVLCLRWKPEFL